MAIRRFRVGKLEKKDLIWIIPTAVSGTFVSLDYIAKYWSQIAIPIPQTNSTTSGYVTVLIPRVSPPLPTPLVWVLAGVFFLGLTAEIASVIYHEIKSLRKTPEVEPEGVVVEPVGRPSADPEKLKALSPIHMMIMAIERVSPREASFGPTAGNGIGRIVRFDDVPNLDEVRLVFSEHAPILGDYHLKKWLDFEAQIKLYRHQGGFWVGRKEWNWFLELEQEYRDARNAGLPQTAVPLLQPELTIAETDLEEHEKIKEIELELQDGNVIRHQARFYYITVRNLGKQSAKDVGGTYLSQQMIFVPLNRKQRFRVKGRYDTHGFRLATKKFGSREEAIIVALLNDERWVMRQRITVHPDSIGETFVLFFTLKGLNVLTIPGGTRIYPNDKERMPCTITLPIHLTSEQIPEHVARFKVNVRDWKHFKVDQIV